MTAPLPLSLVITDATIAALRDVVAHQLSNFNVRCVSDDPIVRSIVGNVLQLLACEADEQTAEPVPQWLQTLREAGAL